jgi:hypothetical protein
MRFHLLMLLIVILVSLGMHGMASATAWSVPAAGGRVPGAFQRLPAPTSP